MLLLRSDRRASRARLAAARLRRLADVPVRPATSVAGRVITVAVRPPTLLPDRSAPDDLRNYLAPWWTTLDRLGLCGTVLCGGFTAEQTARIATPRIQPVEVAPGARHIFFERHFLVRDFLRSIDDPWVFITDGSDVAFKRDPFDLVREAGERRRLFIGREQHRILFCRCVRREMLRQFGRLWFPLRPVLNPGILGGRREVVLEALDRLTALIESAGDRLVGSDMCFVNRAVHQAFAPRDLFTGYPLHSRFKGWEFDTSAAILHK